MHRFLIILAILLPRLLLAQQGGDFYSSDSARDVFAKRPELQKHAQLEAFPRDNTPIFIEPEPEPVSPHTNTSDNGSAATLNQKLADPNISKQDKIKLEFGDPTQKIPVKPVENAPAPMKGMYAALEAGESELAFEYAKQWVRYFERLKYMNKRFVTMTKYARKRELEGQADTDLLEAPLDEDKILYEQDLLEQQESLSKQELDQQAEDLLKKASQDLDQHTPGNTKQAERIKLALKDSLPVDPQGRVDLMFFFNSEDEVAYPIFQEVEKLYQSLKGQQLVNIVGLSLNQVDNKRLNQLAQNLAVTFPLMNGEKVAQQFSAVKSPSFIFLSPSTGKSFYDPSPRRYLYLKQVVQEMQGKNIVGKGSQE